MTDLASHALGDDVLARPAAVGRADPGMADLGGSNHGRADLGQRPPPTVAARLDPLVFAHARVPMLTTTGDGVVVDANPVAVELLGRTRHDLVQEPLGRFVLLPSGRPLVDCLREAVRASGAVSFGRCAVLRRGAPDAVKELFVSSGCHATGRDLHLIQLAG